MGLCALAAVVTWAAVFLLPVFAQQVQGHSALAAGIAMAPQGIVTGLSTALLRTAKLPVRLTVVCGFAVLAAAAWHAGDRGADAVVGDGGDPRGAVGVDRAVINPLLTALTDRVEAGRMADASTLFNVVQRIAGSFGIGLLASLYTDLARSSGPVSALHVTGLVIAGIAAGGGLGAAYLPGHSTARATSA